ncbi:hypothetical protein SH528x_002184 [Novipirellula sp. SH528]|uniref:hypothetical protein n=1 Tax=Novipirellula sp. SH528 TaxID=3454466 RepID=UPI003F9F937B
MAAKKKTQAIGNVTPPVNIEFDWGTTGQRRTKRFDDAHEAKAFYMAKDKAGKNPKVIAAESKLVAEHTPTPESPSPMKGDTTKVPGVRAMRTRPYLAGVIIQRHGLAAGVTGAMVAELDAAYGKPNPTESQFCLKNAWHACRAFAGVAEGAVQ